MLRAYGVSGKGLTRPLNEDWFAIHEDLGLCVVADGMGGHNAGEVAARMAVDAVVDYLRAPDSGLSDQRCPFGIDASLSGEGNLLRTAILLANVQILEAAVMTGPFAGMGTTVVVARVSGDRLTVGHVGDSRLYLLAGGRLRQLTHDDSWMATMLANEPEADRALLQHHPMRNALTNVVGARARTDVHVVEETLSGGELLLLSTDGVHGVLDDRRIERLMTDGQEPRVIGDRILAAALARGSRDDCTVVVARYAPPQT